MTRKQPTHRTHGPYLEAPWLAQSQHELAQRPGVTYIYLLVDEDGAKLIQEGVVPAYVKRQAQRALDWTLADLGTEKDGI